MQKRSEKEQVIAQLHDKLKRAKVAIVAEPNGIDVETVTALRKRLREQNVEYKVVKNTLVKRAVQGTDAEVISDILEGPTALVMGFEEPVSPAKVLQEFISKIPNKMAVRGAVLDGKKIDAHAVEALSKMPGMQELRAMLAGMINRPAQMLASVLNQPSTSITRVLKAKSESEAK